MKSDLRDDMDKLSSEERSRTIQGLTGPIAFDNDGFLKRPIYFSRIRSGELDPALDQNGELDPSPHRNEDGLSRYELEKRKCEKCEWEDGEKQRRIIRVGADFVRISNLDLKRQRFDAELLVWFKWRGKDPFEPESENDLPRSGKSQMRGTLGTSCCDNNGRKRPFHFLNGIHTDDEQLFKIGPPRPLKIQGTDCKASHKMAFFKVKQTFLVKYQMEDFPFDTQKLNADIVLRYRDKFTLVPDKPLLGANRDLTERIYQREYNLGEGLRKASEAKQLHVAGFGTLSSTLGRPYHDWMPDRQKQISVYRASVVLERKPFGYAIKMLFPLMLLLGISFSGYFVLKDFQVRIALTVTTLLTTIVLHIATTSQLPDVGYEMLADKLVVLAYFVMTGNILAAIGYDVLRKSNELWSKRLNWGVGIFLFVFAVAVNLCLLILSRAPWNWIAAPVVGAIAYTVLIIMCLTWIKARKENKRNRLLQRYRYLG
jgi:hypothetical protein